MPYVVKHNITDKHNALVKNYSKKLKQDIYLRKYLIFYITLLFQNMHFKSRKGKIVIFAALFLEKRIIKDNIFHLKKLQKLSGTFFTVLKQTIKLVILT